MAALVTVAVLATFTNILVIGLSYCRQLSNGYVLLLTFYVRNMDPVDIKVILLGEVNAGKTSIFMRFFENTWNKQYHKSVSEVFIQEQLSILWLSAFLYFLRALYFNLF